jgi:hypothetical protein
MEYCLLSYFAIKESDCLKKIELRLCPQLINMNQTYSQKINVGGGVGWWQGRGFSPSQLLICLKKNPHTTHKICAI